ncbi:MAG TPA: hypothetical protein VFE29_09055 [Terriglobia bacterium]|nr:hypothetical protein [Terriglobia bacterium]
MPSLEEKRLFTSIHLYRRLLRIYPKTFRAEFEEHMVQVFGDLVRREVHRGGLKSLCFMWVRIVPDLVTSAVRQHLDPSRTGSRGARWIVACILGSSLGTVFSSSLSMMGWSAIWLNTVTVAFGIGLFQWGWALKRRAIEVVPWVAATVFGMLALARAFRIAVGATPPAAGVWENIVGTLLSGFGIGVFQFLIVRQVASRPWRWIPVNVIANFAGAVGAVILGIPFFPVLSLLPHTVGMNLAGLVMSVGYGLTFGYITSIPLKSMLGPEPLQSGKSP